MAKVGRPPSCECGECRKCKHRIYMRRWYQRKNVEERREWVSRRDPDRSRTNAREAYYRNAEAIKAKVAEYARQNPDRVREADRRWVEQNRDKRRAQNRVAKAVKAGRLVRPDACENCGSGGRIQAHHHDYSKPLDVKWLCPRCHGKTHRKEF